MGSRCPVILITSRCRNRVGYIEYTYTQTPKINPILILMRAANAILRCANCCSNSGNLPRARDVAIWSAHFRGWCGVCVACFFSLMMELLDRMEFRLKPVATGLRVKSGDRNGRITCLDYRQTSPVDGWWSLVVICMGDAGGDMLSKVFKLSSS